jgi:hypothetical protein
MRDILRIFNENLHKNFHSHNFVPLNYNVEPLIIQ